MTRSARFKLKKQFSHMYFYGPGNGKLVGLCIEAQKQIGLWEIYQRIASIRGIIGYPKLDRPNVKRNTARQQLNRLKLYLAMVAWRELSPSEKQHWNEFTSRSTRKGVNEFISRFILSLGFGRQGFGTSCFGQPVPKIINYGWGIQPFGLSTFGSPGIEGLERGFYSNVYGARFDKAAGFGQTLFGRRSFGSPYHVRGNFGFGHQLFGCSSFGQVKGAPWQYGLGWQYFGNSPFGSTLPGFYPGA
ncbi:MAG: hypothetical protein PHV30_10710 [Candidatus Margulisbacteria bacterium]|nr:hypothetical protein [Candidatus Margulisiibacteriota bacterium]